MLVLWTGFFIHLTANSLCVSQTDPESVDYKLEAGATRNFEALRTAELMAQKEAKEKEEELENNPMKVRTSSHGGKEGKD